MSAKFNWRQFARKHRELFRRSPSARINPIHHQINKRAQLAQALRDAADPTHPGMVARITSGMDCDSSQYHTVTHVTMPTPICAYAEYEEDLRWADGPHYVGYGRCSDHPESHDSRDLALEAFENGHPYSIHG